mgnify:CR=1 FL=1
MLTKFCSIVAKLCLVFAVVGLLLVILCVQWQVFGRYIMNDTPTWAESLALLLVLMGLPLVGAVAATDQLRSGSLAVEREPAQSQDSAEP